MSIQDGFGFRPYIERSEENEFGFRPYKPKKEKTYLEKVKAGFSTQEKRNPGDEESIPEYLGRNIRRTAARSAETVAGVPGDVAELVSNIVGGGSKLLGSSDEFSQKAKETVRNAVPFQGSSGLRENITKKLTGNDLEPENSGEEAYDEFVQDIASLSIPVKGKIPFTRALGTALASNTAKQGIKAVGGTEGEQQAAKIGTMFLSGLVNKEGARKFGNRLFGEAVQTIPEDATIGSGKFNKQITSYISSLKKGGSSPEKTPSLNVARDLQKAVQKGYGEVSPKELVEFRKTINDYRYNRTAGLSTSGKRHLNGIDDIISKQLEEYGKKKNPTFLNKYNEGNEVLRAVNQTDNVAKIIRENTDFSKLDPKTVAYLGLGYNAIHHPLETAAGSVAAVAGAQGVQFARRLSKSPVLRAHYLNIIKNVADENKLGLARNLKLFDDEVKKEDES